MPRIHPDRLVMVYNAEDGFFNALTDWAHKIFSPDTYECTLCHYTFGLTGMLRPWKTFIELQPFRTTFFHRTEFRQEFPLFQSQALPLILVEKSGRIEILVTTEEIKGAGGLIALINLIQSKLEHWKPAAAPDAVAARPKI